MIHPDEALLHDFVDDELPGPERARIAGHLADCPSCRSAVTAVRVLRDEVVRLLSKPSPYEAEGHDLWPEIESRILASSSRARQPDVVHLNTESYRERPGRHRSPGVVRIAAGILLVGLSSAAAYVMVRPEVETVAGSSSGGGALATARVPDLPGPPASLAIGAAYEPVFAELEEILAEGRGRLLPETIATLEENLGILDAAIRDVQEALAADPAHAKVLRSLDGMYRAKLGLLRQAVSLTRGA